MTYASLCMRMIFTHGITKQDKHTSNNISTNPHCKLVNTVNSIKKSQAIKTLEQFEIDPHKKQHK